MDFCRNTSAMTSKSNTSRDFLLTSLSFTEQAGMMKEERCIGDDDNRSDYSWDPLLPRKPRRVALVLHNQVWTIIDKIMSYMPLPVFLKRSCFYITCGLLLLSLLAVLFLTFSCISWTVKHSNCYTAASARTKWTLANTQPRVCPPVTYPTIVTQSNHTLLDPSRICLVTLTDSAPTDKPTSLWQKMSKCRSFQTIGKVIRENHSKYAERHGYRYTMETGVLDSNRPPAWSKIKAVQKQFASGKCDWVMWLDADVVIMNQSIRLESLLSAEASVDLIVTPDGSFRVSSGVWLLRRSEWSSQFLEQWWNMRRFVRSKGLSLSGDNQAFGYIIGKLLENDNERQHLHITPERCSMNSNAVFVDENQVDVVTKRKDWQGSMTEYHRGDFIAHAAGIDRKSLAIQQLVESELRQTE